MNPNDEPPGSPDLERWFSGRRFALVLAMLIAAAFPGVLFGGQAFFYRDHGVLAYPTVFYFQESIWRGELPLWNPLSNCGTPFLAQWGTMVCYPGALFCLLFPLPWALGVFCLAHLLLAGLGMFSLARRWTGSGFAGALAGVAFVFNGITLSCLLWPNYLVALGWMPWVVLCVERAWREGGKAIVVAALVAAAQGLAGVPEIILLTWIVLGVSWLGSASLALWSGPGSQRANRPAAAALARSFGRLLLVVALLLGLTAVQTLPFLDLLAHSQRGSSFATAKWSLPLWGWANLFAPLVHCYQTTQGLFFQHGQEFFSSTWLGAGMLVAGAWCVGRVRRGRVLWLTALGLLGLALAFGEEGPLYRGLRWALPIAGVARYPVKFLLLTGFAVPLTAAYALNQWVKLSPAARPRAARQVMACALGMVVLMGAVLWASHSAPTPMEQWGAVWRNTLVRACFLALFVAAWWCCGLAGNARRQLAAAFALLAVVWLDARTHVPWQNPTIPAAALRPGLTELSPPPRWGDGRVLISPRGEESLLRSRVADFQADFLGKRLALWSNLNLLEGVPKVNGAATLQLREQAQVQAMLYSSPAADLPRLADFLGARFVTSPSNVVAWSPRTTASPLITAGQRPVFVSDATALRDLAEPHFDGRRVVYLPEEARTQTRTTDAAAARVLPARFSAHEIEFEVIAREPAWVVIAQSFYHRWQAEVNERPAQLWRANHAFQALEVSAGRSRVRVSYRDTGFHAGAGLSLLALVACAGLWVRARGRVGAGLDA